MTGTQSAHPVLVTGGRGMLGCALTRALGPHGVSLSHEDLDISDTVAVETVLRRISPRLVINCAAATDVDRCESDRAYAWAANAEGPAFLAQLCALRRIALVHVSTDFVFDGSKDAPYTEDDSPHPLSYYGLTKLRGEEAVLAAAPDLPSALVVRTSWVFGSGGPATTNFPIKFLQWAGRSKQTRVVSDQWGSPTYAPFLAEGILALTAAGAEGIYHLAGSGCASRLELAGEVARGAGLDVEIEAATSADFPAAAPRPKQSCLDCARAERLGVRLPPWPEGVRRYLVELLSDGPASAALGHEGFGDRTPERHSDLS